MSTLSTCADKILAQKASLTLKKRTAKKITSVWEVLARPLGAF